MGAPAAAQNIVADGEDDGESVDGGSEDGEPERESASWGKGLRRVIGGPLWGSARALVHDISCPSLSRAIKHSLRTFALISFFLHNRLRAAQRKERGERQERRAGTGGSMFIVEARRTPLSSPPLSLPTTSTALRSLTSSRLRLLRTRPPRLSLGPLRSPGITTGAGGP
ncbi:hypothetical protein FKP32DRAFT_1279623 [Trametes sanguinea]|nr:hypothetical protein FKP32DRAFT_1279623 [Trametes sanguinea]